MPLRSNRSLLLRDGGVLTELDVGAKMAMAQSSFAPCNEIETLELDLLPLDYHLIEVCGTMKKPKDSTADIKVEPGANKRLSGMLEKVLNTPPTHVTKSAQPRKTKKPSG